MAKRRAQSTGGGAESPQPQDAVLALVVMRTFDGFVTGRALVAAADVEWLTPKHTRDVLETRPRDIVLKAEKWVGAEGKVELRPKQTHRGAPVLMVVGKQVVHGELLDACAHRARNELRAQVVTASKSYVPHWEHLCGEALLDKLPLKLSSAKGKTCAHCGLTEAETLKAKEKAK